MKAYYLLPMSQNSEFYPILPPDLRTEAAEWLFTAAIDAGLLAWSPSRTSIVKGPALKNRAQLAYFCVKASTYLGLDRGATTSWESFDLLFTELETPLIKSLYSIGYSQTERLAGKLAMKPQPGIRLIEEFFEEMNALHPLIYGQQALDITLDSDR